MYFPLGFTANAGGLSSPSLFEVVAFGPSPATNGVLRLNVQKRTETISKKCSEIEAVTIYVPRVEFFRIYITRQTQTEVN